MSRRLRRRRPHPGASDAPFVGSPLHVVLLGVVALKTIGILVVFDPTADQPFDLVKSLFSRSTEWLIAGVLVSAVLRYGPAVIPFSPVLVAVGALLGANAVAASLAENAYVALYGDLSRYLGLTFVVDMSLFALAAGAALRRGIDWKILSAALATGSAATLAYGAVQRFGRDPFRWSDDPRLQPFSTFGNSGFFAEFLTVLVPVALGCAWLLRRRPALLVASVGIAGAGSAFLLVLGARSALLGLFGAAIAVGAMALRESGRVPLLPARLAGPLLVLAVALGLGITLLTPLGQRALGTAAGARGDSSLVERSGIYRVALAATLSRPLFGWGPDSVGVFDKAFRTAADERATGGLKNNSAHDWVLQASATTGLIGLGALLLLIVATSLSLWRSFARERVAAIALVAYAAYWTSSLTAVSSIGTAWIPWLVSGCAIALSAQPRFVRLQPPPAVWMIGFAVCLVLAVAGASAGTTSLAASRAMHDYRGTLGERSDPKAGLPLAQRAVSLDPGRAYYWDALGHAQFLNSRFREASAAYEEASRRAPYESTFWISLAQSYAKRWTLGEGKEMREKALAAAERAVIAAPSYPGTRAARSELATELGDADLAFREALAAADLDPIDPDLDRYLFGPAYSVSDPAAARAELERRIAIRESAARLVAHGRLCLRLNDWAGAIASASRAAQLDPGNRDATVLLGEVANR